LFLILVPVANFLGWYAINGWYQSLGFFNLFIASPLEAIESMLTSRSFYTTLIVALIPPVILAVVLGRVFCSWLCPMGLFSEWGDSLRLFFFRRVKKKIGAPEGLFHMPRQVVWFVLSLDVLASMIIGTSLFSIYSPPGVVGREIMRMVFFHWFGGEILIIIGLLSFELLVLRRGFCRYICPLGAALSLLGSKRLLRVRLDPERCAEDCALCDYFATCNWGLLPGKGETETLYCTNCGDCVDLCPFNALSFGWAVSPARPKLTLIHGKEDEGSRTKGILP